MGSGGACQGCMGADFRVLQSLIGARGDSGAGSFWRQLMGRNP
jgi:hypothetical protein